jgi:hypothetical protein
VPGELPVPVDCGDIDRAPPGFALSLPVIYHGARAQIKALKIIKGNPLSKGQYLRNELIDRFYRSGRPTNAQFRLSVQPLRESLIDLDITKSADATRGQLRLETTMSLHNVKTNETLLTRKVRSITSYNILASEFSTHVTEESARENALNDLARQIEMQLSLYFKRQ